MKLSKPFVVQPPQEAETAEELLEKKEQFAELLLKDPERNAFRVALLIYPDDTSKALQISQQWASDPVVRKFMEDLEEEQGDMAFVASKAEQARLAWKLANTSEAPFQDRIKALELCGKITGAIEKPTPPAVNNNVTVNKVMVVRDFGTNDNWESSARQQQKALINGEYVKLTKPN